MEFQLCMITTTTGYINPRRRCLTSDFWSTTRTIQPRIGSTNFIQVKKSTMSIAKILILIAVCLAAVSAHNCPYSKRSGANPHVRSQFIFSSYLMFSIGCKINLRIPPLFNVSGLKCHRVNWKRRRMSLRIFCTCYSFYIQLITRNNRLFSFCSRNRRVIQRKANALMDIRYIFI
jgi:hypothetical protein